MKRVFCLMLAILMLMGAASAQILTTGSVNVRSGPGLEYDTIGSIAEGEVLMYLYETEVDDRDVEWHRIGYKKLEGWVSSKYAKSLVGTEKEVTAKEVSRYKEAASWFDQNLAKAAKKLKLEYEYEFEPSEIPVRYYDDALMIAGYENIRCMTLIGPGYTIHGAAVGMKIEDACAKLEKAGMVLYDTRDGSVSYQRPTPEGSPMSYAEYDSIIYVRHEEGIVYKIDWQGYTG